MSAYPDYKDTGAMWLDSAPAHWDVKRLKFAATLVKEKAEYVEIDLPYMGLENIEPWTGRYLPVEDPSAKGLVNLFQEGDVLLGKLRPYLAKVHLAAFSGAASTEALVLRPNTEILPEYLRYYLVAPECIENINSSTFGSKMPRANWEFIGDQAQLVPPLDEQRAIAGFLDENTAEIDLLIDKKRKLLKLLAEKRAVIITNAVTKGLNPDAPTKDSGIEWLGEVPGHWETRRFRFLVREPLKYGANEAAEFDDPNFPRFIRITDINDDGTLREETFRSLPPEAAEPYILEPGDILLARSGATVGKSFRYDASWGMAAYAGYLIRARLDQSYHPIFAMFFLRSQSYWQWVESIFIQSTIPNISAEKYANLWLPVPPLDEQVKIAECLSAHNDKLDEIKATISEAIGRLTEYRAALITSAVTGKIKVA